MPAQSYANHRRFVTAFHRVLIPILGLTFIGACVNLIESLDDHDRLYSASLLVVLAAVSILIALLARVFALKAQDRAIRAEENLRYYVLTGQLLSPALTMRQVVALRFASDAEFPELAARAAQANLTPDAIKRAVQNWREDTYRV